MIDLIAAENALKDIYLPVISNKLDNCSTLMSKLTKTSNNVYGKNVMFPDENNNLHVLPLASIYCDLKFSEKAIKCARQSACAFVNLINDQVESGIVRTSFEIKRQLISDGSCKLAKVSTISDTGTIFASSVKNILPNTYIMIRDKAGNVNYRGKVINRYYNTCELTFEDNLNFNTLNINEDDDIISDNPIELVGLKYFCTNHQKCADTSLYNAVCNCLAQNDGDLIICDHITRQKIFKEMLDMGIKAEINTDGNLITEGGVTITADIRVDDIYILNTNYLQLAQLEDWLWLSDDENNILRFDPNHKVYNATLVKYCQVICTDFSKQIKLSIRED